MDIFLNDIPVIDLEIKRLENQKAVNFYQYYIENFRNHSLQQNIRYEVAYFKSKKESNDPYMYMGKSYGEVIRPGDQFGAKVYVDLRTKTNEEMVNLAIVKLKMEEDFLSYKFNRFVEVLYEYEVISEEEYNFTTYGTFEVFEIKLVKQGIPIHLISKLQTDNQLSNIFFDEQNVLHCNSEFRKYYSKMDDFYQYQIDKYIFV